MKEKAFQCGRLYELLPKLGLIVNKYKMHINTLSNILMSQNELINAKWNSSQIIMDHSVTRLQLNYYTNLFKQLNKISRQNLHPTSMYFI